MTLKLLLITGMACTLFTVQSYAQASQASQASQRENKKPSSKNVGQNKRAEIYLEIAPIKGETTKKVSGKDCDVADADCKKTVKIKKK